MPNADEQAFVLSSGLQSSMPDLLNDPIGPRTQLDTHRVSSSLSLRHRDLRAAAAGPEVSIYSRLALGEQKRI